MQSGYLLPMLLLAGAGLAAPAYAQDSSFPAGVDWSGFYAGVYGGYGVDQAAASSSSTTGLQPLNGVPYAFTLQDKLTRVESLLVEAKVGANYQINAFVFGIEGGISAGNFGKSSTSSVTASATIPGPPPVNSSVLFSQSLDFSTNAVGTIEGRLGWATGSLLFYGKGGLAVAQGRLSTSQTLTVANFPQVGPDGAYPASASTTSLLFGGTVGIGAEAMVTDKISIGAEYDFVHLPGQTVTLPPIGGVGQATDQTLGDINIHTIKAGINYHF